ncbi:hybrid sensor histidine kinase/response regulator transcription factor [Prevotella sp. P6B4]|uniref:hybrid sensor histidine kinase/response regulator transcription factor n=2 Tax=unclassified Prevotella TaxID=2638335 RepID=UPI00048BABDB|nr:hybrid sensor histidine kinase/response regulator transcription factor [Prevotella sp. P6B4]
MNRLRYLIGVYLWIGMATICQSADVVKVLGYQEGLSSSYVVGITQDKFGFLWFATEEGLNRFDGSNFQTFYKSTGLPGNQLNCVADDPEHSVMWIGSQRDGLCAFDYEKYHFSYYAHDDNNPQSLITNDITSLFPATDGQMWISTYWAGIDRLDPRNGTFTHFNRETVKGLVSDKTWCVMDDGDGHLYIGHVVDGLSIIDIKTRTTLSHFYHSKESGSLSGNDVHCIFKDKMGNIWVGTDNGLDLYDPLNRMFIHFTDNGRLNRRIFDIKQFGNQLWLATEQGGIAILDLSRHFLSHDGQSQIRYISEGDNSDNLSGNSVRSLFQDRFGNIWAGLFGGGVNVIMPRQNLFNCVTRPPYLNEKSTNGRSVLSVVLDNNQNIWVGTDGKGVEVYEHDGQKIATYQQHELSTVQAAVLDSKGRLWMGNFRNNAYVWMPREKTFKKIFSSDDIDVRTFFENQKAEVMLIGTGDGLYEVDMHSLEIKAKHDFKFLNDVRAIQMDTNQRLWIGFFGGGLEVYDATFHLQKRFNTSNSFPSNTVSQILKDRKGGMWVATAEGLVHFPDVRSWQYAVYSEDNGLRNANIHAIVEDFKGNIWISTNKGISCKHFASETISNYGHNESFLDGIFLGGAVAIDAEQNIYFGSSSGLYRFSPEELMAHIETPDVFITGITIYQNDEESTEHTLTLIGRERVSMNYRENYFRIRFNIQDFSLADRVEYAYRMEGLGEGAWHTTAENDITFRDLPPGKYQLQVRCRLRNQEWGTRYATLQIVIAPPFWLSWWAWTFYVLCVVGLVLYLLNAYKHRLRLEYLLQSEKREHEQQQTLNEERLRFYTNITHELRTPLTLIIGPLEDLAKNSDIPQKAKYRLAVIHQSAVRLNNLISELLEFRKMETQNRKLCVAKGNIVETVREVCLKYEELNRKDSLNIRFMASQNSIEVWFDKEVITIIVDNLVSNAIKYTDRGEVTISIEQHDNEVRIAVSDTGHGIPPEALPHVFERYYQAGGEHQVSGTGIGLSLVKNLVELHHAQINVDSKTGEGSRFIVSLKADYNYPDNLHAEAVPQASKDKQTYTAESGIANGELPTMLVVEDNKDIRDYIEESFSDQFAIHTAHDGKEGLRMAQQIVPDIIISDVMMPNMDGNQMCRLLKNDLSTSHIPIILLTAKDSLAAKEEGYDSGADSYITKPFSHSLLASRIKNLLKQRQQLSKVLLAPNSQDGQTEKQTMLKEALSKIDQDFYNTLNQFIDERISSEIDVNYLAEKLCMSTSTLYRKMKSLTGLSTVEYIRKYKMQYAERLMLEGKYTISEIAYMSGFNSINYFRRCFKEEFGDVPSDYLKKLKG